MPSEITRYKGELIYSISIVKEYNRIQCLVPLPTPGLGKGKNCFYVLQIALIILVGESKLYLTALDLSFPSYLGDKQGIIDITKLTYGYYVNSRAVFLSVDLKIQHIAREFIYRAGAIVYNLNSVAKEFFELATLSDIKAIIDSYINYATYLFIR